MLSYFFLQFPKFLKYHIIHLKELRNDSCYYMYICLVRIRTFDRSQYQINDIRSVRMFFENIEIIGLSSKSFEISNSMFYFLIAIIFNILIGPLVAMSRIDKRCDSIINRNTDLEHLHFLTMHSKHASTVIWNMIYSIKFHGFSYLDEVVRF